MVVYQENDLDAIAFELKNFKAAIVPTDTVAGIICLNPKLIYAIKKRSRDKKLITFVCNLDQIEKQSEKFTKIAKAFWPGKLTLINDGISYRMPNSDFILKIISKVGPIYSSSANLSGNEPITSYDDAINQFGKNNTNLIFVNSNYNNKYLPSTIYNVDRDKLIRQGGITYEQIRQCCEK